MREIKFRAWDKEVKAMYEVGTIYDMLTRQEEMPDRSWLLCTDHILMQYTGLKDKNGKEIYEGDILQLGTDKIVYWVVEWDNRDDLPRGFAMTATYPQYLHPHVKETHIIGNIYENPELLSGK